MYSSQITRAIKSIWKTEAGMEGNVNSTLVQETAVGLMYTAIIEN